MRAVVRDGPVLQGPSDGVGRRRGQGVASEAAVNQLSVHTVRHQLLQLVVGEGITGKDVQQVVRLGVAAAVDERGAGKGADTGSGGGGGGGGLEVLEGAGCRTGEQTLWKVVMGYLWGLVVGLVVGCGVGCWLWG